MPDKDLIPQSNLPPSETPNSVPSEAPAPAYPRNPLLELTRDATDVLNDVVQRTKAQTRGDIEELLQDSLFWERKRLDKSPDPMRDPADRAFWKEISAELLSSANGGQQDLLEKVIRYHTREIAGHFDERVYRLSTVAVPRALIWLFQALSWKSFRGVFSEKVDLRRKIHLQGKIDQLQRLSRKGTIVLLPTHFSNLDSLLMGWAIYELGLPPFCYGAGLNLFTNPIFGYFMNNLGAYKVDRKKQHKLYKNTLKNYSTVILERGAHSLFFPGGGRSRSGGMEQRLKLGLLGTAIDAYVENQIKGNPRPNIYIVPCVISYHFVLEAATLIDDYLAEQGGHRYIIEDDESSKPKLMLKFLYRFFTMSSSMYLNFGQAMDPFGNLVDDEGNSIGPNGRPVDPAEYVKSGGKLCHVPQRDQEYTRLLGERILERFHKENIALTSHFIAYAYFEYLKQKYSSEKPYSLYRLADSETSVSYEDFKAYTEPLLGQLHARHREGALQLEPALRSTELRNILDSALRNMGAYHTSRPIKLIERAGREFLESEDMKLLFYYRNRMLGYKLAPYDVPGSQEHLS